MAKLLQDTQLSVKILLTSAQLVRKFV